MEFLENDWKKMKNGKLIVNEEYQYFHNHSKEILHFNKEFLEDFKEALSKNISINPIIRKKQKFKYNGIKTELLNKEIRSLLGLKFKKLKFEVNEKNGVYYFSSLEGKQQVAGFDFALLNSKNNLIKLRNLCFGELKYSDGRKRWDSFLKNNPDLMEFSKDILPPEKMGENISLLNINEPLILGEIQFGNWGLVYRDFFKLLKANVQTSVDCLVYVTCAGKLEGYLSEGIVTYSKTVSLLKEFSKVINVPVWVIGLDIKI